MPSSKGLVQFAITVEDFPCRAGDKVCVKRQLKKLQNRYKDNAEKIKNLKTPYKKIAIFLDSWVQRNFKGQGKQVGGWKKFKKRKDGTRGRWIRGKGLDTTAKLLQDTGRLRASFLPFAHAKDAGIGSDLPYAEKHEKGVKVPVRRILPIKSEVIDRASKIMDDYVKDNLK